jgi:hypothetical protein
LVGLVVLATVASYRDRPKPEKSENKFVRLDNFLRDDSTKTSEKSFLRYQKLFPEDKDTLLIKWHMHNDIEVGTGPIVTF